MKRVVVSAVNLIEGGTLSVMQDCLAALVRDYSTRWEIIALVNNKSLVKHEGVRVLEYPDAKRSWGNRLRYEWKRFQDISRTLDADVWFSLHDISPRVHAKRRVVYCHNPTPFAQLRLRDALFDRVFAAHCLFYGWLYGINIRSNDLIVVQQDWIRQEFLRRYGVRNVLVAHPEMSRKLDSARDMTLSAEPGAPYAFFYPFLPRVFKNAELICEAVKLLLAEGERNFEVVLTTDGTETRYARWLVGRYGNVPNIRFTGLLPREQVFERYRASHCMLFPSTLETWGLPISEFKATGRPMLLADLPYAHETAGDYPWTAYFDPKSPQALASAMKRAMSGQLEFRAPAVPAIAPPFADDWHSALQYILGER